MMIFVYFPRTKHKDVIWNYHISWLIKVNIMETIICLEMFVYCFLFFLSIPVV